MATVGRPSGFVGRAMERLIDGYYTVTDECMYQLLGELSEREGINLEPSALAGMMGAVHVSSSLHYQTRLQLTDERLKNATLSLGDRGRDGARSRNVSLRSLVVRAFFKFVELVNEKLIRR